MRTLSRAGTPSRLTGAMDGASIRGSVVMSAGKRPLTLVYGAKDEKHNQAVVPRSILSQMAKRR